MAFNYNLKREAAEMSKDKNWAILNENPSWVPEASRKAAVVPFRLMTGHDCMRYHHYRICIDDCPDWNL
ncbi:hypothetical protein TNCV_1675871 [Trichonephila clavipes]|nr:hypothetical protein TNCV_1675871 [Trichonephila clavipes]